MFIDFPEVDWQGHKWTKEGQIYKIIEELGEVAEALVNKDHDNVIRESLDLIQTGLTLISMVRSESNIKLPHLIKEHCEKLKAKGYLKEE